MRSFKENDLMSHSHYPLGTNIISTEHEKYGNTLYNNENCKYQKITCVFTRIHKFVSCVLCSYFGTLVMLIKKTTSNAFTNCLVRYWEVHVNEM